jgi:hypothetical protein
MAMSIRAAQARLERLSEELAAGQPRTDREILDLVDDFDRTLQTSCESAAEALLAAIAPLCRARPALVGPLLRRALRPLYYLGCDRAEQVTAFAAWLLADAPDRLGLSEADRAWISEGLARETVEIQRQLDGLAREPNRDG